MIQIANSNILTQDLQTCKSYAGGTEFSNVDPSKIHTDSIIEVMAIDAEWYWDRLFIQDVVDGKIVKFLTKQYSFNVGKTQHHIVLWHHSYPMPTKFPEKVKGVIRVIPCDVNNVNIFDLADELGYKFDKNVVAYMYYSPVDVMGCLLDRESMNAVLLDGQLSKKRNLYGTLSHPKLPCKIKLRDLIGAFNTSLDSAFDMVGLANPYKNNVRKEDKGDMRKPLNSNPNKFLEYALGDTAFLNDLWNARVDQLNEMIEGALGFNPGYTVDTCPRSSGSLVSQVFNQWLAHQYPRLMTSVNVLADVTKKDYGKYKVFKKALREWKDHSQPLSFYQGDNLVEVDPSKPEKLFFDSVPGMARGSIKSLGNTKSTAALNAIVMGGRCNNENPEEFELANVLDIDLQSCYGTALRSFDYPMGRATTWGMCQDDEELTLGEFLSRFESQFCDNLWQIFVEGDLPFNQDFLYSKLGVTPESVLKDLTKVEDFDDIDSGTLGWDKEVEPAHIKGDFVLLGNKVINGMISTSELSNIRKVSSNAELKGWMSLKVVAAAWYPKKLEVVPDRLAEILQRKPGSVNFKEGDRTDNRTRYWCRISLDGFVGNFITYRKSLKKQSKEKGDEFDIKQNAVKLFINTTYGCLAAPYFPMGNVILANNITGRARMGTWMLSKALGTVESITDGGAYPNNGVRTLTPDRYKGVKPGFDTLSRYRGLNHHRSVSVSSLFNFDEIYWGLIESGQVVGMWESLSTLYKMDLGVCGIVSRFMLQLAKNDLGNLQDFIDRTAENHINEFWSHYDMAIPFKIEHKYDNISQYMAYWGSSDYVFIEPVKADKGEKIGDIPYSIKVRGAKEYDHVKKLWLLYLAGQIEKFDPEYPYTQLIGTNQWLEAAKAGQPWTQHQLPGEEMNRVTKLKLTANHLPKTDDEMYVRRIKSHQRAVRRYEKDLKEGGNKEFGLYRKMKPRINRSQLRAELSKLAEDK